MTLINRSFDKERLLMMAVLATTVDKNVITNIKQEHDVHLCKYFIFEAIVSLIRALVEKVQLRADS
jgi:hypothetical protein